MTSSEDPPPATTGSAEALTAAGWERCFVADEPRLSESVETYRELGYEVTVLPVELEAGECNECLRAAPDRFKVIYIRRC